MDAEQYVIGLLTGALGLDPKVGAEVHVELALGYLEEGRKVVDEDPVQASEKLYKAAEEVVRALALHFNLSDILEDVARSGRWCTESLWKAALRLADGLGEWSRYS